MAATLGAIYQSFDYAKSPAFSSKLEGKSEGAKAMQMRLLTAEKRADAAQLLGVALCALLTSNDTYQLIVPDFHHLLDKLRALALSVSE
jgi:hypothetical protein